MNEGKQNKSDAEARQSFTKLIELIASEMIKQPANRNLEGFYTTKNIFLGYGRTEKEHKFWRDRGMHADMQTALLDQYNNLNPDAPLKHIKNAVAPDNAYQHLSYPDISWEDLECHAAMIRIDKLLLAEAQQEKQDKDAEYQPPTLEQVVELDHVLDASRDHALCRSTILKLCKRRQEQIEVRSLSLPQPLYTSGKKLRDIEIIEFPAGNKPEYRFRKPKEQRNRERVNRPPVPRADSKCVIGMLAGAASMG